MFENAKNVKRAGDLFCEELFAVIPLYEMTAEPKEKMKSQKKKSKTRKAGMKNVCTF